MPEEYNELPPVQYGSGPAEPITHYTEGENIPVYTGPQRWDQAPTTPIQVEGDLLVSEGVEEKTAEGEGE